MLEQKPTPTLDRIMADIGAVGRVLARIAAAEGAAGNISVVVGRDAPLPRDFSEGELIELPLPVPELEERLLVVTGSGRRLPDIADDPAANLGCLRVEAGGRRGRLICSPRRRFERLTSELNSHLAVHQDQLRRTPSALHALVHAQPRHLTYLSHVPGYCDVAALNRRLFRWQPETILNLPHGVGVVPFFVPGSPELMEATVAELRTRPAVVWCKHGVLTRCASSVRKAGDLIEYLETAAHYVVINLACGERARGLTPEEIRRICDVWSVEQSVF